MPRRRRVPVTTKAARAAQERLTMLVIDPAFEPHALERVERMRRLRRNDRERGRWRRRGDGGGEPDSARPWSRVG
jgi:hypothetical protein